MIAPVAPMRRRVGRAVAAEHARETAFARGKPHVAQAVAHDAVDPEIGQAGVEGVHPREQLAGGVVMPNGAERAVPAVIVKPDVSVRPPDHIPRNVVSRGKKDGVVIDHLVNAAVPGGDIDNTVAILSNARNRDGAANLRPVLPARAIPFPQPVSADPAPSGPDIPLRILHQISQFAGARGVKDPGRTVEFRNAAGVLHGDENMIVVPNRELHRLLTCINGCPLTRGRVELEQIAERVIETGVGYPEVALTIHGDRSDFAQNEW